jgi:2,5-diketo-D-gluconate reductase B
MSAPLTMSVQGVDVPRIGFGTWQITGSECVEAVRHALELGYRHIDTARAYDNEREVGRGIVESGIPREEIFITTKVWMDDASRGRLRASAEASLRDLGVDQVDLLLLHWPAHDVPLEETVDALTRARHEGLTRLIGVSNFPPRLMRQALELGPVANNQVEYHPYLGQPELHEGIDGHDAFLTAYSPLAHGRVGDDETLRSIGDVHGKSPGQVALRWLLDQPRVAVVPKASSPQRRAENLDVFDFEPSEAERVRIDALPKDRRGSDPGWAPDWDA